jgi:toxin ParE1/3/4
MIPGVTQRPRARLDLLDQFIWFAEESGVELAERWFAAVDQTCQRLLQHPRSGVLHNSGIPGLAGLRRAPVTGFENFLLFYLPGAAGIDVIRVLHGARDIENIFAGEES